jgi:hypothetical protein
MCLTPRHRWRRFSIRAIHHGEQDGRFEIVPDARQPRRSGDTMTMVKRHILAFVAAFILAPCSWAAPVKLGPEVPLSDLEIIVAPVAAGSLTAASNGRDFLVAWQDRLTDSEITLTRVGVDGHPFDPAGRRFGSGSKPKLARAGSGYLLVWRSSTGLESQRLDENGAALSDPQLIAANSDAVALLTNGSTYLLVYLSTTSNGSTMRGAILDGNGAPLHSLNRELDFNLLGVGDHNGDYVAVVSQPQALTLYTIADDGSVTTTALPRSTVNVLNVSVAFAPSSILFAWGDLYSVLGYDGSIIKLPNEVLADRNSADVSAAWDGHEFLMVNSAKAFRIASDGTLLDPGPFTLSQRAMHEVSVVSSGTELLVASSEAFGALYNSVVGRVAGNFDALAAGAAAIPLASAPDPQMDVQIAQGPNGLIAVWSDPAGLAVSAAINGVPRTIDEVSYSEYRNSLPAIAAGSRSFLVVWRSRQLHSDRVLAARFDFNGKPIGGPFVLDEAQGFNAEILPRPSVVFDGTSFFVAWSSGFVPGMLPSGLRTVHVPEAGPQTDGRVTLVAPANISSVRAFWTGTEYLVASVIDPAPSFSSRWIVATRFDRFNIVTSETLTAPLFGRFDIGSAAATFVAGRVTYAWEGDDGISVAQTAVAGATAVAPRVIIPRNANGQRSIADIVWNGSEYVLVWREPVTEGWNVRGIRLNADLQPMDAAAFDIAGPGPMSNPSLLATSHGVTIAYSRYDDAQDHVARVFVRSLDRVDAQPPAHRRAVGH